MKVSLELFKGKLLKDGSNPILIRISDKNIKKYKSTGVSSFEKNWKKDKYRISCRERDYKIKNEIISKEYNRVISRVEWFKNNGFEYDLEFILSDRCIESYNVDIPLSEKFNSDNFLDIILARIESYSKLKTKENYQAFYRFMKKNYGDNIKASHINQYFVNEFRNKIDSLGFSANHKNDFIKCFSSSYKFGAVNRWINRPYIFELKKFPISQEDKRYISFEDLTKIINCYKKHLSANFNISEFKSLAVFVLDIALQGLAPIDLAKIKVGDIKLSKISKIDKNYELYLNSDTYQQFINENQEERNVIIINTFRTKTNTFVPICSDYNSIRKILLYFCKGKTKDDYLLDCFSKDKQLTEKQINNRCGNYFMKNRVELNNILTSYCRMLDTSLIPKITFYFARHAFINALDKMNISHDLIRKMIGHKGLTLEKNYINKPTKWEQSTIIYNLFNQASTIRDIELSVNPYIDEEYKELYEILISNN